MKWRQALLLTGSAFLLACEPTPPCKTVSPVTSHQEANAGCIVMKDGQLLTVRQRNTGRLNTPGGSSDTGESAECTAHRETWEETGLDVEVGRLLKVFKNGFHLFSCQPANPSLKTAEALTPPLQGRREVSEVLWISPSEINPEDWRYPHQINDILHLIGKEPVTPAKAGAQ